MTTYSAVAMRFAQALLLAAAFGCAESPVTSPENGDPDLAKGSGGGVTVAAADPAYGKQGAAGLVVRVLGSGFDDGSRASWEREGGADPKITVNSTDFVSSTELRANIDIAADAQIDLYDIAVYTTGGRKGIGTEKFEVTAATSLGFGGLGRGINDNGQVAGYSDFGAFVWTAPTGVEVLGPGVAWEIDQAGTTVVGTSGGAGEGAPQIWTRTLTGIWSPTTLPNTLAGGGAALAVASDAQGAAVYISGNANTPVTKRERIPTKKPARWIGSGTSWTLDLLPLPSGVNSGRAEDINSSGIAVGLTGELFDDVHQPLVWEGSSVTVLPPIIPGALGHARAINGAGTLVVGESNGQAVLWQRSGAGALWGAPVSLDTPSPTALCGSQGTSVAYDASETGVVVGQSCGGAVAWRIVGGAVADRIELGGLGPGEGLSWSEAVNSGGTAAGRVGATAGIWQVP